MSIAVALAQVFGLLGALWFLFSNWQKNKKKLLSCLLISTVCYFIQYILLKAYTGAFTNLISIIRVIAFGKKGTTKFFKTNYVLYIMLFLYVITGIFTYDGPISLLPTISIMIYTIALWQDDTTKIGYGSAIMFFMLIIYNALVGAYTSGIVNVILLVSSIASIVKSKSSKQTEKE